MSASQRLQQQMTDLFRAVDGQIGKSPNRGGIRENAIGARLA